MTRQRSKSKRVNPSSALQTLMGAAVVLFLFLSGVVLASPGDAQQGQNGFQYCGPVPPQVRIERVVATNGDIALDGDGDASDFFMVRNVNFDPIDLDLWQVSDGSRTWIIPPGVVIPGYEMVTIWASGKGEFGEPGYPGPSGELHTNFLLAPGGETLTLAEPSACIADQLTYPAMRRNQMVGYDAQNQLAFLTVPPRPEVCAAPSSVTINAVQLNNRTTRQDDDGDFSDWFELRNATVETLDVGGWLVEDGSRAFAWALPEGTVLQSGEILPIWADGKNRGQVGTQLHTNFSFANTGETLRVSSSPSCVVDQVTIPELLADAIWQRGPDGTFSSVGGTEPGERRTDQCVVVNELMTHNVSTRLNGPGEYEAWIELANYGADPIDMSDWRLRGRSNFWPIPDGTILEPGRLLLIWAGTGEGNNSSQVLYAEFELEDDGGPLDIVDANGREIALMSYPSLGDDESFGIGADGEYSLFGDGEATPGTGAILSQACELRSRPNAGTDIAAIADDVVGMSQTAEAETTPLAALALTGRSDSARVLAAQLLIASGAMTLVMARISKRRVSLLGGVSPLRVSPLRSGRRSSDMA